MKRDHSRRTSIDASSFVGRHRSITLSVEAVGIEPLRVFIVHITQRVSEKLPSPLPLHVSPHEDVLVCESLTAVSLILDAINDRNVTRDPYVYVSRDERTKVCAKALKECPFVTDGPKLV